MAEKEERILIEKRYSAGFPFCVACWTRNGKDYFCSWGGEDTPTNKEICEKKCPYDNSISRQEAIKKISSHLLMCDISTMDTDEIAEAALNALLEDK